MDPLFELVRALGEAGVDYVLVGGMAAVVHGSPVVTPDIDVFVPSDEQTYRRILSLLRDVHPRVPLRAATVPSSQTLSLVTDVGSINIVGELPGVRSMADLAGRVELHDVGGFHCRVLELESLIGFAQASATAEDEFSLFHLLAIRSRLRKRLAKPSAGSAAEALGGGPG